MNLSHRVLAACASGVLVITLAGCADDTVTSTSPATSATTTGAAVTSPEVSKEHNDEDVTFAQMMTVHHEGALEMAELAEQQADSRDVRELASEIKTAQVPEIELMQSWLGSWDEPLEAEGHEGMDMGGMDMDGMSQEQVMEQLRGEAGPEFDEEFLTAMIAHHEGAVMMSQQEIENGLSPEALVLASDIIDAQQSEIEQMQQLRQEA